MSIDAFCRQDYPRKELIIVASGALARPNEIEALELSYSDYDITLLAVPTKLPLGFLRNLAVEHSSGKYICQWDDDDIYHPHRIAAQLEYLRKTDAHISLLSDNFHLFETSRQLYWCDWRRSKYNVGLPGSLFALKSSLPKYTANLTQHEDSGVLRRACALGLSISTQSDCGYLYTYVYHGGNTFQYDHHLNLVRRYGFSERDLIERQKTILRQLNLLSHYSFLNIDEIDIMDCRGMVAFCWSRSTQASVDESLINTFDLP
jgi:glycosyltransferase involved in cell wall biosynthesis